MNKCEIYSIHMHKRTPIWWFWSLLWHLSAYLFTEGFYWSFLGVFYTCKKGKTQQSLININFNLAAIISKSNLHLPGEVNLSPTINGPMWPSCGYQILTLFATFYKQQSHSQYYSQSVIKPNFYQMSDLAINNISYYTVRNKTRYTGYIRYVAHPYFKFKFKTSELVPQTESWF